MARGILSLFLLAGLVSLTLAQEPKKAEEPKPGEKKPAIKAQEVKPAPKGEPRPKPVATLHVGDPAPAIKVDKWLYGSEVKGFEKGKIYVMEFWATWCGPCIVMMPHLSEIQKEYRDKGVTIIGFTSYDRSNTEDKVVEFVEKKGAKLGYTMAYAKDSETKDAWMKAAAQFGIPCTFVVDRNSKLAYIGHPMFLDLVLPKVVDGTWTVKDGEGAAERFRKIYSEAAAAAVNKDVETGFKEYSKIEKDNPWLASVPYLASNRMQLFLKAKQFAAVKKIVEKRLEEYEKFGEVTTLVGVVRGLVDPVLKEDKDLKELAISLSDKLVKKSSDNASTHFLALLESAKLHDVLGNKVKAKESAEKGLEVMPSMYKQRMGPILEEIVEKANKK